jgi:ABC-type uncharacterized transport system involved in gliding motility auxiliary subunit
MNKGLLTLVAALAAFVLFVAINIVSGATLSRARVDLTQNRLFTLSDGARVVAAKLDEGVRLRMFFTERAAADAPDIRAYGQRVRQMLEEFARASGGKVTLEVIDPEPFSEQQDEADAAGLIAPQMPSGNRLYFGLVATNSVDQRQTIPLFNPQSEQFLEYDVTRLLYLLSNPKKPAIGLITALPIEGQQDQNPMSRRGSPPWAVVQQAKDLFDIRRLAVDSSEIPADIKVLWVVHPKNLSDQTLYAIDQFVLRGGRLLLFVDPHCEADVPPGIDPMQAFQLPKASQFTRLFDAWGIEMVPERILADRGNALRVTIGSQARPEQISYLAWAQLKKEDLSRTDAITGSLQNMTFATSGVLRKKDGASITFEPLAQSSADAMLIAAQDIQFIPDPKKLLATFAPTNERYTVAARLTGMLSTAFPAGNPATPAAEDQAPADPKHLTASREAAQVIVVSDCDMLADRFWIQQESLGGIVLGQRAVSGNGEFVIQSLDNLGGSSELMSLRARGQFARPFEKVDEIRKNAESQFRSQEQAIADRVRQTEQRLQELQKDRPETGGMIVTAEQRAEMDKLRVALRDARKEQRGLQFQLNKDVDRLGQRLQIANIAAMPVLVGVFAIGLAMYRGGRRRSVSRSGVSRS